MKSNEQLQKEVMEALRWEPKLDAAEIGVTVHEGIVTLTGIVDNYNKKRVAETAAKKVAGVKAIVEKIEVVYANSGVKTDEEIAKEVLASLQSHWNVPDERIKVKVENGWVTAEGAVTWNYQREATKHAIENVQGVKGVTSKIELRSSLVNVLEKKVIEKALQRHWSIDADDIEVSVDGHKVTLTGKVGSIYQKEEASKIAWKTPGVMDVDNKLIIEYEYDYAE